MRNVAEDEEAMTEPERLGTMTTPVTVIVDEAGKKKGEEVICFNREKLERLLGL